MLKSFILLIKFMTRIPIPIDVEYTEERIGKSVVFMPVVGLIIGVFLVATQKLSLMVFDKNYIIALFVLIAGIIITGALHIDGLADTFDGVFSYRSKERMLEIMKDPRIGTNGVVGIATLLIFKLLFMIDINIGVLLIMPIIGRTCVVWCAGISDYARNDGMGNPIVKNSSHKEIIITSIMSAVMVYFINGFTGIICFGAGILFTLLFTKFIKSKIDGVTGDTLGAVIEISEVVVLITGYLLLK